MSKANLLATALILGWIASIAGCGGTDDSSTDSASGSGGNEAIGGSDGTGGSSPNELPAVKGDDGKWHCTEGMALSTEKKEPPMCNAQPSTLEPDAAPPSPDSTMESPADMGTEPTPDAATECRDWSEEECERGHGAATCVLLPAPPQPGYPCLWNCVQPDHQEITMEGDLSGDDVPEICTNLAE